MADCKQGVEDSGTRFATWLVCHLFPHR